jgi:type IV fimbrial biogenesis protein FimT
MRKFSGGFTLVELLVSLAVAATLASLSAPTFVKTLRDMLLLAYTHSLLGDLAFARSESIKRGRRVVLCKSSDGVDCTKLGQWSTGWLIFEDTDNDGERSSSETIIRGAARLPGSWRVTGNNPVANYISYHPMGRTQLISGAFQAGTLTICETSSEPIEGAKIIISASGRPRSQKSLLAAC